MKRLRLLIVSIMMVLGMSVPASAQTLFSMTGLFAWLGDNGVPIHNTSAPYSTSPAYFGFHTPISGTILDPTDGGTQMLEAIPVDANGNPIGAPDGSGRFNIAKFTVNTFNFLGGSAPGNVKEINVYTPGSYTFEGEAFEIAPNTMGAHMLYDWNGTTNIDVVLSLDPSGLGMGMFPDTHYGFLTHPDGPFSFASLDDGGDGILGHPMWNGPFRGMNLVLDQNVTGIIAYTPPPSEGDGIMQAQILECTCGTVTALVASIGPQSPSCNYELLENDNPVASGSLSPNTSEIVSATVLNGSSVKIEVYCGSVPELTASATCWVPL